MSWHGHLEKVWLSIQLQMLNPPLRPEQAAVSNIPSLFFCIHHILGPFSQFFLSSLPLNLDHRGESRTPQRVRTQFYFLFFYNFRHNICWQHCHFCRNVMWLCCDASYLSVYSAFCMTEQKGPVCLYHTPQAQKENDKWVWHLFRVLTMHLTVVKYAELDLNYDLKLWVAFSSKPPVRQRQWAVTLRLWGGGGGWRWDGGGAENEERRQGELKNSKNAQ